MSMSRADEEKPTFVLDELKHTEPMPGPVWRDRAYVGQFGDAFMEDTDLKGEDKKKLGDIGALMDVLQHTIGTVIKEKRAWLTEYDDVQLVLLQDVQAQLRQCTDLCRMLAQVKEEADFASFLANFRAVLAQMQPGDKALIPGGWRVDSGGHAVMHLIERYKDSFSFVTINPGAGSDYHPSSAAEHPKMKVETSIRLNDIPPERILDDGFWYFFFKLQVAASDNNVPQVLYELLLPHLAGDKPLALALAEAKEDPCAEARTPQRARTNYLRCMLEATRYLVRQVGLTRARAKQLSFCIRRQLVAWTEQDLKQLKKLPPSDALMIRLACTQLARAAVKESDNKRLDTAGLADVNAQIARIEALVKERLDEPAAAPQLNIEMQAKWRPFPDFDLFRRAESTEPLAGHSKAKETSSLIDLASLPTRENVNSFEDALNAMRVCLRLCDALEQQHTASSYFQRTSLIQALFCDVLPMPLPPLAKIPGKKCIWTTASFDYATQLNAMRLLNELARIYVSSARSVRANTSFLHAQAVVMAAIVCVMDAVLRTPATDKVSVVTHVLNGTEYLAARPPRETEEGKQDGEDGAAAQGNSDASASSEQQQQQGQPPKPGDENKPMASALNVKPVYFLSMRDGKGNEFSELSERYRLSEPGLVLTRGAILDYFNTQQSMAQRAIFNFPTDFTITTTISKTEPTVDFIKQICQLCGYTLNPPNPLGGMDETKPLIQVVVEYLIDGRSPFVKNQPELLLYRDTVFLFKLVMADHTHMRGIRLRRWTKDHAKLEWYLKELSRNRDSARLNVSGFGQEALCLTAKEPFSPADAETYIKDFKTLEVKRGSELKPQATEDDVLHLLNLPSFGDILSEEDAEKLLSYLTVPYMRIPLVLSFFANKDRVPHLLNRDIQAILEAVLFEPRRWKSARNPGLITTVPSSDPRLIGAAHGMLLNEIEFSPEVVLESLLKLARLALELNTGSYTSSASRIILFVTRLVTRVTGFLLHFIDHKELHTADPPPDLVYLEEMRGKFNAFLLGPLRAVLREWERQADERADLQGACVIHAHQVLLYRGIRDSEFTAETAGALIAHLAFLQTSYSPGLGQDENSAEEELRELYRRARYWDPQRQALLEQKLREQRQAEEKKRKEEEKKKKAEEEAKQAVAAAFSTEEGSKAKREKNIGEGKAEELEPLEVPDQELFDLLQARRRGVLEWCANAAQEQLDDVLQSVQAVATRDPTCVSRGWKKAGGDKPVGGGFGIFINSTGDIEINVQTADVFFRKAHIAPVPANMARTADFGAIFGQEPQHCAMVAEHDHRTWVRLVGKNYNLKLWTAPKADTQVINKPMPNPPNWADRHWTGAPALAPRSAGFHCFTCGTPNPVDAGACGKCRRPRPRYPNGFTFRGVSYSRMYVPPEMKQEEKWIFDLVEPLIFEIYPGGRKAMKWELYLPKDFTDPDARTVRLLGCDYGTYKEFVVYRDRGIIQVFALLEHGRRMYRSLIYTTDHRYCFRSMDPDQSEIEAGRAFPWSPVVRYARGRLQETFSPAESLVISREITAHGLDHEETYVPARFFYGLLPQVLLDHFFFWQRDRDDSFHGYPRNDKDPAWRYKLHVRLVDIEGHGWCGIVHRQTLTEEDERANRDRLGNLFNVKKQLEESDPLIQAINRSKVSTLTDQGWPAALATFVLKTHDWDLPLAQAWLDDPANKQEIEDLKKSLESLEAEAKAAEEVKQSKELQALKLIRQKSEDVPERPKHQLTLLNLFHAAPGSMLWRLATVLTRIEDLSHILVWTNSKVTAVDQDVNITKVELPRLKLNFQPRLHEDHNGTITCRLYSLDHAGLFVSDQRTELLNDLMRGLDYSLLMEDTQRELHLLVPNSPLHRPLIRAAPFSTELVLDRGNREWQAVMNTRFFLYPIHISQTFLMTPTQSSAVFLILLRLLARQYDRAFQLVQSCEADMRLSEEESFIFQQLRKVENDVHPDAHACRLKLSLVMLNSKEQFPWLLQEQYSAYLGKYPLVSRVCRLTVDEELYLLKYIESGAETEELDELENRNELEDRERLMDVKLANRLAYLRALVGETPGAIKGLAGAAAREEKRLAFLQNRMQRGDRYPWHTVHEAATKYFSKTAPEELNWEARVEYVRPGDMHRRLMLEDSIKVLNKFWNDTITGDTCQLGYLFLIDLLTDHVRVCLTDPSTSNSKTLGKLFSRLLFMKSTAWGARTFDFEVFRSQGVKSFVPYILCSLLPYWPAGKALPRLQYEEHRHQINHEGLSTSFRERDSPIARHLEQLVAALRREKVIESKARLDDMSRTINAGTLVQVYQLTVTDETLASAMMASSPEVSDLGCETRTVNAFKFGDVALSETERATLCKLPLSPLSLSEYIVEVKSEEKVSPIVKFDVSGHPEARTHVAKELLKRLDNDMGKYAEMANNAVEPKVRGMLDADLARYARLDKEIPEPDAKIEAEIKEVTDRLCRLINQLEALKEADMKQMPLSVEYMLKVANDVSVSDGDAAAFDKHRFLLQRYSGQQAATWLDFIAACLMSTAADRDLKGLNPFLPADAPRRILDVLTAFLLRVNRVGHINRAIAQTEEILAMLRQMPSLITKIGREGLEEREVFARSLGFKADTLAKTLMTARTSIGLQAGQKAEFDFDPRFVVFEYLFNILLRQSQVDLVNSFVSAAKAGTNRVYQMIMGAGKTTVIGPLLSLILADGKTLVTQVVPSALLEFSRGILRSRFTRVVCKRIHTLSFDRSVKRIRTVTRLYEKLEAARKTRGIVVTTPEAIKSLMLKYLELLHTLEDAPPELTPQAQQKLAIMSEMADQLSKILNLWKEGDLIMDEVDLLLHPLRSELNFPIGQKYPLDLSPDRWELPIHLLDAIFYFETNQTSVGFHDSDNAKRILKNIKEVLMEGVRNRFLQTSPHLVLLNPGFYHERIKGPLSEWVLLWLRNKGHVAPNCSDELVLKYLMRGPFGDKQVTATVRELHSSRQRKMLNLAHDWVHSFAPHVLAKINRVSYGLLTPEDMSLMDLKNMPKSRALVAVPFIGKDVPSQASEFAHPDVLIGLTILAYRYEGLRRSDVHTVVLQLQHKMRNESGPYSQRPASVLFEQWVKDGEAWMALRKKLEEDRRSGANLFAAEPPKEEEEQKRKQEAEEKGEEMKEAVRPPVNLIPPLPIFQIADDLQMGALFERIHTLPDVVHHYLKRIIFPKVMQHQRIKLSASGQELGGDMLFRRRFGFSGTPSDLLPLELGKCGYEAGSEGRVMSVLTDPRVVSVETPSAWSVKDLLRWIAQHEPPFHALIDTGALITGMTNEEVARFLLDNGLPSMEGVVFLDRNDKQMILLRQSGKILELAQCGVPKEKRFTFYDQVHTTGMDIKQALNATAVVTLGKDMTFRDYSQGAYRMRGIGVGQTIRLYIIPEVLKLIKKEVPESGSLVVDVAAWLTVNSMRSEKLQFMQLVQQSLRNVWRKRAFRALLHETTYNASDNPKRFWRFQEAATPDMQWLRKCIQLFREEINFSVLSDVETIVPFDIRLRKEVEQNKAFVDLDKAAPSEVEAVLSLAAGDTLAGLRQASDELHTQHTLDQEMVQQQEQQQEQKKTIEQEEQTEIQWAREDEAAIPWPVHDLVSFERGAKGLLEVKELPPTKPGETRTVLKTAYERHAFYPLSRFSLHSSTEGDLLAPPNLLLSHNYFRPEWAAMTAQRRLKNVAVILEWLPSKPTGKDGSKPTFDLTAEQKRAAQKVFRLLLENSSSGDKQRIRFAELKEALRYMGSGLSREEEESLLAEHKGKDADGVAVAYEDFEKLIRRRCRQVLEASGARYFVGVSLAEAETLRRLIHSNHPLLRGDESSGVQPVCLALRTPDGILLDRSFAFRAGATDSTELSVALQAFRFLDCDMFFSDPQIMLLLRALAQNSELVRQSFFANVLRCRRRDRRIWKDTPLARVFTCASELDLMAFRASIARIRKSILSRGWSIREAFEQFDRSGDGLLAPVELTYALETLKVPGLEASDIQEFVQKVDKNEDELIDLNTLALLFRDAEQQDWAHAAFGAEDTASAEQLRPASPRRGRIIELSALPAHLHAKAIEEEKERLRRIEEREKRKLQALEAKRAREKARQEAEAARRLQEQLFLEQQAILELTAMWKCDNPVCGNEFNEPESKYCAVCQQPRPAKRERDLLLEEGDGPLLWDCEVCTAFNPRDRTTCQFCSAKRPQKTAKKVQLQLWACGRCKRLVAADSTECDVCGFPKEGAPATAASSAAKP